MLAILSDFSLVGIVLAVTLAIILLAGVALYVAFRVKETLGDERGRVARTVKVAFLVGMLFLSGGVFFFFASGFGQSQGASTGVSVTSTTPTTGSTGLTTGATSSMTVTTTATATGQGQVSMQVSYPNKVKTNATFTISFLIVNSGGASASSATIDVGRLFSDFRFQSCTNQVSGNYIIIGTLPSGSTVVNLVLQAPSRPAQTSSQVTLTYVYSQSTAST
ncbi:MAG: hypothetical protein HY296_04210 [Thaumarchaeota archaeon]|nr:hypothetical protein [Nitrososphaerota archaeon]